MIVYICIFLHSNCLKMWWLKTTTTYFYLSLYFRNLNRDQLIHSTWHWLGSPVLLIQLVSGLDWKVLRRLHSYIWFIMLLNVVFSFSTWYHSIYLPILSLFLFTVSWGAFPEPKWKAWWVKITFKGRELASPLKRRDNTWKGMREIVRVLFWRLL